MKLAVLMVMTFVTSVSQGQACFRESREETQYTDASLVISDSRALLNEMPQLQVAIEDMASQLALNPEDLKLVDTNRVTGAKNYFAAIAAQKSSAATAALAYLQALRHLESTSSRLNNNFAPFYGGFLAFVSFVKAPSKETLIRLSHVTFDFAEELRSFAQQSVGLPPSGSGCSTEMAIAQVRGRDVRFWFPPTPSLPLNLERLANEMFSISSDRGQIAYAAGRIQAAQVSPTSGWQDSVEVVDAQRLVETLYSIGTSGVSSLEQFEVRLANAMSPVSDDLNATNVDFPRRALARKLALILNAESVSDFINLHEEFENMAKALNKGAVPKEKKDKGYL